MLQKRFLLNVVSIFYILTDKYGIKSNRRTAIFILGIWRLEENLYQFRSSLEERCHMAGALPLLSFISIFSFMLRLSIMKQMKLIRLLPFIWRGPGTNFKKETSRNKHSVLNVVLKSRKLRYANEDRKT